jgi:hypothetical protein
VEVTVHNNGPTSPVTVGGAINVGVPNDCEVENYDLFGTGYGSLSLVASVSQSASADFNITCSEPGVQEIVGCAIVQVNQLHTTDQVPISNNYGTDNGAVEVDGSDPVHTVGSCTTVDPPEICGNGIDDDADTLVDEEPDTDGDGLNDCDDTDDDGDGFADVVEEYVGTAPLASCPWLPGVHAAWPPDFDNRQSVDILDVLSMKPAFGSVTGDANFAARPDLNMSGGVDIIDVLAMKPYFGTSCQ